MVSIEKMEAAFEALGHGLSLDEKYGVDAVFTQETLDDFVEAADAYHAHGGVTATEAGGFAAIIVANAQVAKGRSRGDLVVIDFGERRAAYQA